MIKSICFFAKVDKSALDVVNFYKQDLDILRAIGYKLTIATKWSEINWSCDIIFIWWWTWAFVPVFLSRIRRKKIVITGTFNFRCPFADSDYFRRSRIQKLLIQYSVKNADKNVFVSELEMNEIVKYWKLKNCVYSPHIVETGKYFPITDVKRDKYSFLSICWTQKTNMRRKCLYEMIDVVKELVSEGVDIKYRIAGRKGDGYDELSRYIIDNGLFDNVFLLGEIEENYKIQLMRECSIYFQISKFEGFGLAIAEAMACGAPVISSCAGEVPNVVGDAGILCDTYSISGIKEKVKFLLQNDDVRKELSEKAYHRIHEKFNYTVRFNDLKNILKVL
jgi:glycosyltransferase involved in cell wall biosynthesis